MGITKHLQSIFQTKKIKIQTQCLQLRFQTEKFKIQTKSGLILGKNPDHFFQKSGLNKRIKTFLDFQGQINHEWLVQKVPEEASFMCYFVNFFKSPDFWQKSGPNPDQFGQKSPDPDLIGRTAD